MTVDFFSWDFLITQAGCVAATMLVTQFLKGLLDGVFPSVPTRYWAFLVAYVVLAAAQLVLGQFEVQNLFLNALNAVVVAMAATGTYDLGKQIGGGE